MNRFNCLNTELRRIAHIKSAQSLLAWDQEVFLPKKAIQSRSEQLSILAQLSHQLFTSDSISKELATFIDLETGDYLDKKFSDQEKAFLRELYKDWKRAQTIPGDFLGAYTQCCSEATHIWSEARANNDFKRFMPILKRIIDYNKQLASYIDNSKPVYDVLLNDYEPGMTASELRGLFGPLKEHSVRLLKKIKTSPVMVKSFSGQPFDADKQWQFTIDLLNDIGYDFDRGRQDKSTHPFTIQMHPTDVRITTRLNLFDPFEAITSSIHEGGHALYEQGLPEAMFGTPLGEAVSLGIHESQSRLYENHVARSLPFWEKHFKRFESYFPDQLKGFSPEDLYGLINKVQAGPIRVEADELTYNLHVFIRFEIEDALFNSDLKVEQLPELWNETYKQYLSVDVKSDSEGVLQDIHWAGGSFGYFPTYTVGTIVAAQLYRSIESTMNVQDLQEVKRWLNTTIHQYGRQYTAKELVERATGKSFSSADFIDYSTEKYSRLYRLNT